jgi:hypothetical protein
MNIAVIVLTAFTARCAGNVTGGTVNWKNRSPAKLCTTMPPSGAPRRAAAQLRLLFGYPRPNVGYRGREMEAYRRSHRGGVADRAPDRWGQ